MNQEENSAGALGALGLKFESCSSYNLIKNQYYPQIVYDLCMTLSSYKMHRIYLAATMGYGLGSDDPKEIEYYKKLRKEMEDMKKDPVKKGIPLSFEINEGKNK